MKLVIAATVAFLLALILNQVETVILASTAEHPVIPHWLDQRYLFLAAWGFPVLAVWGFNARWLPVFLGLREPSNRRLMAALGASACGLAAALLGQLQIATVLLLIASILATASLGVFWQTKEARQNTGGLHVVSDFRSRRLHLASHRCRAWRVRGACRWSR